MKHLTSIHSLTKAEVLSLLERANFYSRCLNQKIPYPKLLNDIVVANLFFENSTRTRFSFEIAAKRLGAHVLNFQTKDSSLAKGESLMDTLKTFKALGTDIGIIRHSDDSFVENLGLETNPFFSIINAGAGKDHHPSQSLLDLFTIKEEFQKIDSLTILICGDIINSRVAKSNIEILSKFDVNIILAGPLDFLPEEEDLGNQCQVMELEDALKICDVAMFLRVQHERHGLYEFNIDSYNQKYGLNQRNISQLKKEAIIMHPGPVNRGVEIEGPLVDHKQSRIFKQKENGVYTRMAILEWIRNG